MINGPGSVNMSNAGGQSRPQQAFPAADPTIPMTTASTMIIGGNRQPTPQGSMVNMTQMTMPNQPMMMQNIDPMTVAKNIIGGGSTHGTFDWNTYAQTNTINNPLNGLLEELNQGVEQPNILLKQQTVMLLNPIILAFKQEIEQGSAHQNGKYLLFLNTLEKAKLAMSNNIPCPIRTQFIEFVKKCSGLRNLIGTRAISTTCAWLGNDIVRGVLDAKINPNDLFARFTQQVINISMLEMVNWFNNSNEGKHCYFNLTKELKDQLTLLPALIQETGMMFEFFTIPNPYADLSITINVDSSTAFSNNGGFSVNHAQTLYTAGVNTGPNAESCGLADPANISHWLENNARLYKNTSYTEEYVQHDHRLDDLVYHNKRKDYDNMNKSNYKDFDLDFLIPVPHYKNTYITKGELWNNVKTIFPRDVGNKGKATGKWEGDNILYLVTITDNESLAWNDQIIRAEGLDVTRTLLNPELVLPFVEADKDGNIIVTAKNNIDVSIKSLTGVKTKDSMDNYMIDPGILKELKNMYVVTDETLMKETSEKNVEIVVDSIGKDLLAKSRKDQIIVNTKPVLMYKELTLRNEKTVSMINEFLYIFIKGRDAKVGSFFNFMESLNKVTQSYLLVEEPELMEILNHQLSMTVTRWLSEKRGYEGVKITNILFDFKDIRTFLEKHNDMQSLECLYSFSEHKWIYEHCEIFADVFSKLIVTNPAEGDEDPEVEIKAKTIIINRELIINRINNYTGPGVNNDYINIKRSLFPEVFAMVEKGYDALAGEDKTIFTGTPELVLSFANTDTLWSFTYSDYDDNVGIMRQIHRGKSFIEWDIR